MDIKEARQFIDYLKQTYKKPIQFQVDANQLSDHCVGGILIKAAKSWFERFCNTIFRKEIWGFPSETDIADTLQKLNKKLTPTLASIFAREIVDKNDHEKFNNAWESALDALVFDPEIQRYSIKTFGKHKSNQNQLVRS